MPVVESLLDNGDCAIGFTLDAQAPIGIRATSGTFHVTPGARYLLRRNDVESVLQATPAAVLEWTTPPGQTRITIAPRE